MKMQHACAAAGGYWQSVFGYPACPADLAVPITMEAVGRREAESLMRRVRYLSDIGTIAPMLGLLGTVLGMIQAFNFIAFDISAVKPVALASAVAQALVTTAAGLIVAIPCMGFFFYFRGQLQSIVAQVEEFAVEIADTIKILATRGMIPSQMPDLNAMESDETEPVQEVHEP